jgi:hypothetical protein
MGTLIERLRVAFGASLDEVEAYRAIMDHVEHCRDCSWRASRDGGLKLCLRGLELQERWFRARRLEPVA